jgi:hypothetical protein
VTVTVESAATGALSDTATVDAIESDLESANNTDPATSCGLGDNGNGILTGAPAPTGSTPSTVFPITTAPSAETCTTGPGDVLIGCW